MKPVQIAHNRSLVVGRYALSISNGGLAKSPPWSRLAGCVEGEGGMALLKRRAGQGFRDGSKELDGHRDAEAGGRQGVQQVPDRREGPTHRASAPACAC